ncbi:GNAT family N-acetyltransferase [Streptomyces meridianus]|uniref:GNAT family N-acetyltransferase n=1 Tax=Streptomyces meridianus TaxID=2938945 RepID=A0ABT0X9V0_9ACTN|nr:GNAT family N-acetyltransferase [Streptomyces meridianus]MCM2578703.1 GNAT family N-acetyltransferase [Streptomyces meridianus]
MTAHQRSSAGGPVPGAADGLTVTTASLEEWEQVVAWAAVEDWNPGRQDAACFHPTDPAGFFVGRLDGRIVSAVSVVIYSPEYAFLGYYLVDPEHRERGLGLATWHAALPHAVGRTVGLDAVPAQQATYERSGFTASHRSVRWAGRPVKAAGPAEPLAGGEVVPVTADHVDAIAAYDRRCFPAERRDFLARWLSADGHTARAVIRDGGVAGYGVVRPARSGRRIGPLFADTAEDAEALLDALIAVLDPGEQVFVDVPETHETATALAEACGLSPSSHTVRMYNGPVLPVRSECTYAVTSLELG